MKAVVILALMGYAACCVTNLDCPADECCLRQDIMIASRKRQLLHVSADQLINGLISPLFNPLAKCIPRAGEGESCSTFNSCGCQTGLTCHYMHFTQPLLQTLTKRISMMMPGECQADPIV